MFIKFFLTLLVLVLIVFVGFFFSFLSCTFDSIRSVL